jgi:uncharacterized protein (DUF305 family)
MDKNKVAMIAVGAGITGLLIGLAVSSLHHGGRDDYKRGMSGRDDRGDMMEKHRGHDDKKQMDMTGMDHSKMDMDMMMVASERDFIMGMIPHHEEAISSAKEVLARGGTTAEIKTLAENIVKAQEAEVTQMKDWYKNWYGADYVTDGKYKPMMRDTTGLSGAELDKAFLTDMIPHHQMAVMMATSVDAHIEHDEVKKLSENIKNTQTDEIETMQDLLSKI